MLLNLVICPLQMNIIDFYLLIICNKGAHMRRHHSFDEVAVGMLQFFLIDVTIQKQLYSYDVLVLCRMLERSKSISICFSYLTAIPNQVHRNHVSFHSHCSGQRCKTCVKLIYLEKCSFQYFLIKKLYCSMLNELVRFPTLPRLSEISRSAPAPIKI